MTRVNIGGDSFSSDPSTEMPIRRPSRGLRAAIAVVLSLLLPGMGQLYVRRILRGLVIAVLDLALNAFATELHLFTTFSGMIAAICLAIIWRLWVAGDAFYLGWIFNRSITPESNWAKMISALGVIFVLVGYPVPGYFGKRLLGNFRAYKISSRSMCPTICEGERIVATPDAYKLRAPERGNLLLFDFNHTGQIFTKRVIGVAGDTVSRGPANTILVNNRTLTFPKPCGKHESFSPLGAEGPPFNAVKVPEGSLFVIGDNLDDSYDSRFFGLVTMDEIKAKPLFIYWSPNRSRIGCQLH